MKTKFLVILLLALLVWDGQTFTLKSGDSGGQATARHVLNDGGGNGQNIPPRLSWQNAPAGTKSIAVTLCDEDAPYLSQQIIDKAALIFNYKQQKYGYRLPAKCAQAVCLL